MPRRGRSVSPCGASAAAGAAVVEKPLLVLKVGTSTIMQPDASNFSLSNLGRLVDCVCDLKSLGYSTLIVSSGAVGAGCMHLKWRTRPSSLAGKQAASAVGQCRMMRLYEDLFAIKEQKVAQLILTRTDLLDRGRFVNLRNTLKELLAADVVPVINENDSLATSQLRFGDNDTLAAYVSVTLEAKWLFLLTDVDCLYTGNPRSDPAAQPIAFVSHVEDAYKILDSTHNEGSRWGSGGMKTKVVAAKIATACGIPTALCHGMFPERVVSVIRFVDDCATAGGGAAGGAAGGSGYDRLEAAVAAAAAAAGTQGSSPTASNRNLAQVAKKSAPAAAAAAGFTAESLDSASTTVPASPELPPQERQAPLPVLHAPGGGRPHARSPRRGGPASDSGSTDNGGSCGGGDGHGRGGRILPFDSLDSMPYLATIFAAQEMTQHIRTRRRWVLSLPVRGRLYLDRGAARAIGAHKSLFAAGLNKIEGDFRAGDAVALCFDEDERWPFVGGSDAGDQAPRGPDQVPRSADHAHARHDGSGGNGDAPSSGCSSLHPSSAASRVKPSPSHFRLEDLVSLDDKEEEVARCLINFSSDELRKIRGARSNAFSDILGYDCGEKEVANRQNIVLVNPCRLYASCHSAVDDEEEDASHSVPT